MYFLRMLSSLFQYFFFRVGLNNARAVKAGIAAV
jgi:hypothetical protein